MLSNFALFFSFFLSILTRQMSIFNVYREKWIQIGRTMVYEWDRSDVLRIRKRRSEEEGACWYHQLHRQSLFSLSKNQLFGEWLQMYSEIVNSVWQASQMSSASLLLQCPIWKICHHCYYKTTISKPSRANYGDLSTCKSWTSAAINSKLCPKR